MPRHPFGSILSDKFSDHATVEAIAANNVFNDFKIDDPDIDELSSNQSVIISKRNIKNVVIDAFYEVLESIDDRKLMDILYESVTTTKAEIIIKGGGACRIYDDKFKKALGINQENKINYAEKISDIDVSLESENLSVYDLDKVAIKTLDNIRNRYYNYIETLWSNKKDKILNKVIGEIAESVENKNIVNKKYHDDIVNLYNDKFSISSQLNAIKNGDFNNCRNRLAGIHYIIQQALIPPNNLSNNEKKMLARQGALCDKLLNKPECKIISNGNNGTGSPSAPGEIKSFTNISITDIETVIKDKDMLIFYKPDDNNKDTYIRYAYKTDQLIKAAADPIYNMNKKRNNFLDITFNNEFTLCKATIDKFSLARLRMCLMLKLELRDVTFTDKSELSPDQCLNLNVPVFIELYDISVSRKKKESYVYEKSGYYFSTSIDSTISFTQIKEKQKAYSLEYVIKDLINVLYVQQFLPWLDKKYEKRIKRIFYYSMIYDLYSLPKDKCIDNFKCLKDGIKKIVKIIENKENPPKDASILRSIITEFQLLSYNLKFKHSSLNYFTENNVILLVHWYFSKYSNQQDDVEFNNYKNLLKFAVTPQKCPDYSIIETRTKLLNPGTNTNYEQSIISYLTSISKLCDETIDIINTLP